MKVSLEVDGIHYYEGDIVTVEIWGNDEPVTYMGMISSINNDNLILDYSYIYTAQTKVILFDMIRDIRK